MKKTLIAALVAVFCCLLCGCSEEDVALRACANRPDAEQSACRMEVNRQVQAKWDRKVE